MPQPTRFTSGVSTKRRETLTGSYPLPDTLRTQRNDGLSVSTYVNDFFTIGPTADWTITGTSSTFAVTSGVGGVALVTPGAATTVTTVAGTQPGFQFIAGQRLWYQTRLKASAVSGTKAFQFGLQNGTGATPTNAILFRKSASTTAVDLVAIVNGVTTVLAAGVTTVADDTYVDLGFYFTGQSIFVYVNNVMSVRVTGVTIGASGTTLPNTLMTEVFQITPTATDTLSIDSVFVAQEVVR